MADNSRIFPIMVDAKNINVSSKKCAKQKQGHYSCVGETVESYCLTQKTNILTFLRA